MTPPSSCVEGRPTGHTAAVSSPYTDSGDRRPVPVRTILATIGLVLLTALLLYILNAAAQVLTWIVVGAFFAVALYPLVGLGAAAGARGQAAGAGDLLVFLLVFVVLAALVTAFAVPLVGEGTKLAGQLPQMITDARTAEGPIGDLLQRTNALQWVQTHQATIQNFANGLTTPAVGVLRASPPAITGMVTIFVLAYLMVLEGPKIVDGFINLFPPATGRADPPGRRRLRQVRHRLHLRQPADQRDLRGR